MKLFIVYGKLLTEGFPEPHSQNYFYTCDFILELQNSVLRAEISERGIIDAAKFTLFESGRCTLY